MIWSLALRVEKGQIRWKPLICLLYMLCQWYYWKLLWFVNRRKQVDCDSYVEDHTSNLLFINITLPLTTDKSTFYLLKISWQKITTKFTTFIFLKASPAQSAAAIERQKKKEKQMAKKAVHSKSFAQNLFR